MHVNAQILLYCLKHLSRAGNKEKERKEKKRKLVGSLTVSATGTRIICSEPE
jgi:hypothetical protein